MAITAATLGKLSNEQLAVRWDMLEVREQTYTDSIRSVLEAKGDISPIVAGLEECQERRTLIEKIVEARLLVAKGWWAWAGRNCLSLSASVLTFAGSVASNVYEGIEAGTDKQDSTTGVITAIAGGVTTLAVVWFVSKVTTKKDQQKAEKVALERIQGELLLKLETIGNTVRAFKALTVKATSEEEANARLAAATVLPADVQARVPQEVFQAYAIGTDQLTQTLVRQAPVADSKGAPGLVSPRSHLDCLRVAYHTQVEEEHMHQRTAGAAAVSPTDIQLVTAPLSETALVHRVSHSPEYHPVVENKEQLQATLDSIGSRSRENPETERRRKMSEAMEGLAERAGGGSGSVSEDSVV